MIGDLMPFREILAYIVVGILVIGIFIAFPIFAASKARKRGRKGWALATLITMFVGYGWLIGLIALLLPSKESITFPEGCPYCHYDHGTATRVMVDKRTGEKLPSLLFTILMGIAGVLWFGGCTTMAILAWMTGDDSVIQFYAGSTIAGLAYLSIGIVGGSYLARKVIAFIKADKELTELYYCPGCNRKWNKYSKVIVDRI